MIDKLLILDLDETLIHARETRLEHKPDFTTDLYHVYKRPYVDDFLEFCKDHYKVAVWTTAGMEFAQTVYNNVFGPEYLLEFLWARNRCTRLISDTTYEHEYIKDLTKVKKKGFKLEHIIMVDDTPDKLRRQYGNLVRIEEFTGDTNDTELLRLKDYLLDLKTENNVRRIEKRGWQSRY